MPSQMATTHSFAVTGPSSGTCRRPVPGTAQLPPWLRGNPDVVVARPLVRRSRQILPAVWPNQPQKRPRASGQDHTSRPVLGRWWRQGWPAVRGLSASRDKPRQAPRTSGGSITLLEARIRRLVAPGPALQQGLNTGCARPSSRAAASAAGYEVVACVPASRIGLACSGASSIGAASVTRLGYRHVTALVRCSSSAPAGQARRQAGQWRPCPGRPTSLPCAAVIFSTRPQA